MAELYDDEFIEEDMGMGDEEIQAAITLAIEEIVKSSAS